jgi:hypothetical protein
MTAQQLSTFAGAAARLTLIRNIAASIAAL